MAFSLLRFKRKRATQRRIGAVAFWGGLFLLVADMTTSFPTPVRGQYGLLWLAPVLTGGWMWFASKRLPLEETVEIARDPSYFGELRVTELTGELNVSLDTAERILTVLERKGYARREDRGEISVWVFPEVKDAGPAVRRSVESRKVDEA